MGLFLRISKPLYSKCSVCIRVFGMYLFPVCGCGLGGEVRWGRYSFAPEALEWGVQTLKAATPCDLLVVDELGPLELEAGEGLVAALDVLDEGGFSLALVVVRPELVEKLEERLGGRVAQVLEVTLANREQLPALIVDLLAKRGD